MKLKYISIIFIISFSCTQDKREEYVKYHTNNEVALSGTILNDLRVGRWVKYDSLGNKIQELEYDSSGLLTKRKIYSDGFLFADEEMKGEDYKHGLSTFYYPNGSIEGQNYFMENEQLGEQKFFFQDGTLSSKYVETDTGIIDFTQYYENGNLMVKANSLINGEVNMYDSLGNNLYDLLYRDGELVDTLKIY